VAHGAGRPGGGGIVSEYDPEEPVILWMPVLDTTGMLSMPVSTFGTGNHGDGEGVPVPEAGGALIDRDIAELVALLNRADVETVQSCQDLGTGECLVAEDDSEDDDDAGIVARLYKAETRLGCVVVTWESFPAVGRLLPPLPGWPPGARWPDSQVQISGGWLFTVSPNARFVSIVFPWACLAAFTESVRAELAS